MSPGRDFNPGGGVREVRWRVALSSAALVVALSPTACSTAFDEAYAYAAMVTDSTTDEPVTVTATEPGETSATTSIESSTSGDATIDDTSGTTGELPVDEPPTLVDLRVGGSVAPGVFSTPGLVHVVAEAIDDDETPPAVVFYESRDGGPWTEVAAISEPPYTYAIEITGADYSNGARSVRAVAREQLQGPDEDDAGPIDFTIAVPPGGTQWWSAQRGADQGDSEALDLVFDGAGNLYVTGYTSQLQGGRAIWVARYLVSGQLQWQAEVQRGAKDLSVGRGVAVDSQGNAFVVGSIQELDGQIDYGVPELYVARFNPSGELAWESDPGKFTLRAGYAVVCDESDNLVITGERHVDGVDRDVLLMGVNGDSGSQRFSFSFGGERGDVGHDLALTGDGDAVIVGALANADDQTRAFVRRHDLDSDSKDTLWVWESDVNSSGYQDEALSLAILPDERIIVAGSKRALPSGTPKRIAFDVLPTGVLGDALDLELSNQYGPESMRAAAANAAGRFALAGVESHPQGTRAAWTQYYPSVELYAWIDPEGGPAGPLEISYEANAVAVGPQGTVAIAGHATDEEDPGRTLILVRTYYP